MLRKTITLTEAEHDVLICLLSRFDADYFQPHTSAHIDVSCTLHTLASNDALDAVKTKLWATAWH